MNIVLIGARGSGKSVVARELSRLLKREALSTDGEIERRAGTSIREYVEAQGWEAFRALETEVVRDLAARDSIVLDTGGGVVVRPENIRLLRAQGLLFWLQAPVETLAARIKHDTNRPPLTPGKTFVEEIADVLSEREPLYTRAAHHIVQTEHRTAADIALEICEIARAQNSQR